MTSCECPRRLDGSASTGSEVYRLVDPGELAAGKGPDGLVYVRMEAIAAYLGGA